MAVLEPAADPSPAETLTADPAPVEAPQVDPATAPADPMADAAERLYGDPNKPQDTPPTEDEADKKPPEGETDEQKAEREKTERLAELHGAPEGDYADFALPEGVKLDETGAKSLADIAKELNLSQKGAQKLIDLGVEKQQRDAETARAQLETVHTGWVNATKTDKEFGGDKLPQSLAVAQKALKEFGSPELNELVVGARLGDHPEFVRLMYRVGQKLSEAPIVRGSPSTRGTPESVLYPSLK